MSLTEKYRPRRLADMLGQAEVVQSLTSFAKSPQSAAFILHGETGTGKTSAALALAHDLGCDMKWTVEIIASGDQTADKVRALSEKLHSIPMWGSGWRVVIVNEADHMSKQAQAVWLDVLEDIPDRNVIVFTTNELGDLSSRFRDRCITLEFESSRDALDDAVQSLVKRVWQGETGVRDTFPDASELSGIVGSDGKVSLRRAVQAVGKMLLTRTPVAMKSPASVARPAVRVADTIADLRAELAERAARNRLQLA